MVGGQLAERQMFHYPPYYRLVYVYLKNRNETLLDLMAQTMAAKLRTVFGNPCAGTGQAARSTRTDPVHPKDCLEDRNQCPDGPCPRTARPGAKGDGGGRPLQVADSVL